MGLESAIDVDGRFYDVYDVYGKGQDRSRAKYRDGREQQMQVHRHGVGVGGGCSPRRGRSINDGQLLLLGR